MAQYCRYCAYCFSYDDIAWCEKKEIEMTEAQCKHSNKCKSFRLNEIDALMENDKGYRPTGVIIKKSEADKWQITIDDILQGPGKGHMKAEASKGRKGKKSMEKMSEGP